MAKLILPYHARHDSLAHLKGQPLFVAKSMRDAEMTDVVKSLKSYLHHCGLLHPECEAISFYAGNAVWAEIAKRFESDEPLPPEVLKLARQYLKSASLTAQRLMYYLILIITRESRHVVFHHIAQKLQDHFGTEYAEFNSYMHGASGSMHAKELFLAKAPNMKLGVFADAISYTFHNGHFSGGFGGSAWAEIADVFKGLVDGKLSPEMATDVAWALCHNNGPIFNKAMTYHGYHPIKIKTILDVQRSGQIPELVCDNSTVGNEFVADETTVMVTEASSLFPGAFGGYVDWAKVEAAGSVQSYHALKVAQAAKAMAKDGKKIYYVTPDTWVEVFERKKAA